MLLSTRRVVSSATCILSLRPLPSAMRPIPPRTLLPHQATVVAHTLRGADGHETGGMQQPGGHVLALPVVEPLPAASLDGATTVLVLGHPPLLVLGIAYRNRPKPTQSPVISGEAVVFPVTGRRSRHVAPNSINTALRLQCKRLSTTSTRAAQSRTPLS